MLPMGCANTQRDADTKGIKIGDLASNGKRIQPKILHTTDIEVISYELPAENVASMEDIWQMLNPGTLRYNDSNNFAANGLRAAMGKFAEFTKITAMLKTANATKLPTTSLLMNDNQPELIGIARMSNKAIISYIDRQGAVKTADVGLGIVGLQLFTQKIISPSTILRTSPSTTPGAGSPTPGTAPMASLRIVPAILASTEGAAPAIAERLKEHDLRIYSAGFSAILKPGEFVLLGPAEYKQDDIMAASRFFNKQGPKPAIRIFLLVCVSIS